jgi:DNA-binding LytR/AlgR family response regulator
MPTALIAEDEPLLAQALRAALQRAWPDLTLPPHAQDGDEAIELALALRPDVLFLDIRMPGPSGLEAAHTIVDGWPAGQALPLIVFVTAYDQYALQAFEASAVDYVLKPVQPTRLAQTCQRLQGLLKARLAPTEASTQDEDALLARLRHLLQPGTLAGTATPSVAPLRVIQASVGATVHLVPVDDVVYFEAADKYVRVLTATQEWLIRTSLRELLPQLDGAEFWQIHRGTVVRARDIRQAVRDEAGRVTLHLRSRPERLAVSRLYAGRFKGM